MFVFPDYHFYVANGMPSQLIRLAWNCAGTKEQSRGSGE